MISGIDIVPYYFSRAQLYQQHRWQFDRQAIASLLEATGVRPEAIVADIGAGTGMSSRPFLEAGCQVYALEPGSAMRQIAEEYLAGFDNFHSLDGRAEATGLPPAFADLIVAGRALHWFPQAEARMEFRRICKPGGWLAVMEVKCDDEQLLAEIRGLARTEAGWDLKASKMNRPVEALSYFFDEAGYKEIKRSGAVHESWTEFLGRLRSLAAAPDPGNPLYGRFEDEARAVFESHQLGGQMAFPTLTTIAYGHPY